MRSGERVQLPTRVAAESARDRASRAPGFARRSSGSRATWTAPPTRPTRAARQRSTKARETCQSYVYEFGDDVAFLSTDPCAARRQRLIRQKNIPKKSRPQPFTPTV